MLIFYSPAQRRHHTGYVIKMGRRSTSYERPERVDSILQAAADAGWPPAAPEKQDVDIVHEIHDAGMLAYLETAYAAEHASGDAPIGGGPLFATFFPPPGQRRRPRRVYAQRGLYCTDTGAGIGPHTWAAALASAGCAAAAARHVVAGERFAYALCRPPGHHAGPAFFGGYCYLNNAAVATHVLRQAGGRVAILDIDYHHGNGTQAFFEADPDVWYGSLHIDPVDDYPFFAGYADEIGVGPGQGTVRNVPLPAGTGEDGYLDALTSLCDAALAYAPRWLVVSAGFDTYVDDPIGSFAVTTEGYERIGRRISVLGLPTVVVQEGGYHIRHLGRNVVALLRGLQTPRSR